MHKSISGYSYSHDFFQLVRVRYFQVLNFSVIADAHHKSCILLGIQTFLDILIFFLSWIAAQLFQIDVFLQPDMALDILRNRHNFDHFGSFLHRTLQVTHGILRKGKSVFSVNKRGIYFISRGREATEYTTWSDLLSPSRSFVSLADLAALISNQPVPTAPAPTPPQIRIGLYK